MIGHPEYLPTLRRLHRERGHDTRLTGCQQCHRDALALLARPNLRVVRLTPVVGRCGNCDAATDTLPCPFCDATGHVE